MVGLEGKRVTIFYNDCANTVSRKDGICTKDDTFQIELDRSTIILKGRIVRIEVTR